MPTILESLLFEIGIDSKRLKADAKESEDTLKGVEDRSHKTVQELEERGRKSGELFKGLKQEAGGFFAMVASAYSAQKIAGMSKDLMLNAESLGFMASNLGMATERLKAWQLASEKNGGTSAGITGTLQQASMAVAATKRGLSFQGQEEFFAQGGTMEDLQSVESYMSAISRIVQRAYSQSPQAGMNVAQLLGVSPESLNLIKQGPDAIRQILEEQAKYANVSESWAKTSHETMNNFRNIGDSLTKIGSIMLESVNPQLKEMAEFAERAANAAMKQKAAITENTPMMLKEAGAVTASRGLFPFLGRAAGGVGAIASDLMFPKSTVSQAQEDAELARAMGGNLTAKQERLKKLEQENGLPPGILDSVWLQESGRGKNMLSPAGAQGHFQFMPKTWEAYGNGGDPYDFDASSDAAALYLKDLMKQHNGDTDAALRWYNAGGNYRGSQAGAYSEEVRARMPMAGGDSMGRTEVNVNGPVTIQTNSTDPKGIKQEFSDSMSSYGRAAQLSETGTH